jgi:ketosteroid isomerase-like protein
LISVKRVVLTVVLLLLVWFAYRHLFPNDEAQIRAVLDAVADALGDGAAEGSDVRRLARAASIRSLLDADITVEAGPPFIRLQGRDTIIGTVARLNGSVEDLEVGFDDVQVTVAPDGATAHVYLTAEAQFRDGSGARGLEARELDITFRKQDGDWLVADVALVQTLEPLTPR